MDANSINLKAKESMFNFIFKAKSTVQELTKNVLLEIGYRLVQRSIVGNPALWKRQYWPKNYIPGHFINNWQVGVDVMPTGIIGQIDASGSGSYARLQKLGRWQVGHTYYFVNNLPYAALLESGLHSVQSVPMGIVGLTRSEFQQIVKDVQMMYGSNKFNS